MRKMAFTTLAWLQLVTSLSLASAIVWGYSNYQASLGLVLHSVAASVGVVSNVVGRTAETVDARRELVDQTSQMLLVTRNLVKEKPRHIRKSEMNWGADLIGVVFVALGALLGLKGRKRKFDRTNEFGVERFRSYGGKLRARFKDGFLGFTSLSLLASGIAILAFEHQNTWGWIVLLPICVFMLFALLGP
jgi:hypothetical protein